MKRQLIPFFLLMLLAGCSSPSTQPISPIVESHSTTDTTVPVVSQVPVDTTVASAAAPPPTAPEAKAPAPVPTEKKAAPAAEKDEIHRFTNGKVSVRITPWVEENRTITLYDPTGAVTYTFEDTRRVFSSVTHLSFREDGSVSQAKTHLNPGASRYMHYSNVTFSNQNEPLERRAWKEPAESLRDDDNVSHWDKATQKWVRKDHPGQLPDGY